jgi:hypothetical protein
MTDASRIPYAPQDPDDWTGDVGLTDEAIDELADRVATAEGTLDDAVLDSDFAINGLCTRTAAGIYANRTIQGSTGIDVTNGSGVSGNPSIAVDSTVLTDSDFSSNGVMCRTSAGAYTTRTISGTAPITVSNGTGALGNPTVALTESSLAGQVFTMHFFDSSASSSTNNYLILGASGANGEIGKNFWLEYDCSLIAIRMQQRVTAYTSGAQEIQVRLDSGGGSYSTLATLTFTTSGTDNNQIASATYNAGTYGISAGEAVLVRRVITSGGMTTDDTDVVLWFQIDDPTDPETA